MRVLIQKTLLIIALIAFFFIANGTINYFIYTYEALPFPKTPVLITGDSQMRNALDPKNFSNSVNIAHPGEVYAFSYWKLLRVLKTYHPDTIILGFSPINIAKYSDSRFVMEEFAEPMYSEYYPIQRLHELDTEIGISYMTFYKTLWKQTAFYPKFTHDQYIGEYKNSAPAISLDATLLVKKMFLNNPADGYFSEMSINYLDSIVQLCQSKQITLVLTTSPVHKNFLEKIPSPLLHRHSTLKEKYKNQAVFFDLLKTQYPDSCYSDVFHLSRYGAKLFTKDLVDYLNEIKPR
jgi:hypothetical protein